MLLLMQGSEDLCVRGWDVRQSSKVPAVHLTGFVYFPTSLALSHGSNSHLLAAGCKGFNSNGCEVKIWDLRGGRGGNSNGDAGGNSGGPPVLQHQLTGHEHDVTGVQFMKVKHSSSQKDDLLVMSVSRDGYMRRWEGIDLGVGDVTSRRYMPSDRSSYTCLHSWQGFSSDTNEEDSLRYCAVGDVNGSVHVVDCDGTSVHSTAPGVAIE
mmetsp:Transcript_20378/g.34342  ORF Transcript_20378/g.34342 Transcript_20378/m.34342 type:complete len:209 (-) Transcript_20378:61-687(-)